jgi:hypothetical protein
MLIKGNGFELEITEEFSIWLGLRKKGLIFKNRDELSDSTIAELSIIQDKAQDLVKQAEQLLTTTT